MIDGIGPAAALLLAANVGLSLLALYAMPRLVDSLAFRPYDVARGRRLHTVVSAAFVHADMPHLLFNMVTFWFFGIPLERLIGTGWFVVLYGFALLVSQAGSYLKHRNNPDYATLGASGAISGVLFASIVYLPTQSLILLPIPIPIPAPLYGIGYLAYSWWSARQDRGRINHDAHFGGAIAGLLFVAVVTPGAYPRALAQLGIG
jgi:membrane associated rhomboid family serine protease